MVQNLGFLKIFLKILIEFFLEGGGAVEGGIYGDTPDLLFVIFNIFHSFFFYRLSTFVSAFSVGFLSSFLQPFYHCIVFSLPYYFSQNESHKHDKFGQKMTYNFLISHFGALFLLSNSVGYLWLNFILK